MKTNMNDSTSLDGKKKRLLFTGVKSGDQPFTLFDPSGVELVLPEDMTFEELARKLFEERGELWQGLKDGQADLS